MALLAPDGTHCAVEPQTERHRELCGSRPAAHASQEAFCTTAVNAGHTIKENSVETRPGQRKALSTLYLMMNTT